MAAEPQADTVEQRVDTASPPTRAGARRRTRGLRPSQVPVTQPQLRLGAENDQREREADGLAEELAATRASSRWAVPTGPVQRVTPADSSAGSVIDPSVGQLIRDALGEGRPLQDSERSRRGRFLGAGLGDVRLHTDRRAGELNRRLGSIAFTAGQDIFFGHGEFDPASAAGGTLLDHELVHTAQQADGGALIQRTKERKRAKTTRKDEEETEEKEGKQETGGNADGESMDEDPYANPMKAEVSDDKQQVHGKKRSANADQAATVKQGTPTPADRRKLVPTKTPEGGKPRATAPEKIAVAATPEKDDPAAVKVKFGNADEMAEHLKKTGLVERGDDYKPRAVQVGVVVWNINHLKQVEDDEEDAQGTQAQGGGVSIDDVLEEDEYEGDEEDQIPEAEVPQGGQESMGADDKAEYPTENILDRLSKLQSDVAEVAPALISSSDESRRRAKREEGAQFETDIKAIKNRGDLLDVAKVGIDAMMAFNKRKAGETIEDRGKWLKQIRALNQLWNRLIRIRRTLFTGEPFTIKDGEKKPNYTRKNLRDKLRKLRSKDLAENAMEDITEETAADPVEEDLDELLDELLPSAVIQRKVSALKQELVVELTTDRFFRNKAVNLVLINEMNLGIESLEQDEDSEIRLSAGPVMLAKGKRIDLNEKSGILIGKGENQQRVKARQYEYYPALHRHEGDNSLTDNGTFYVGTKGYGDTEDMFAPQDPEGNNAGIPWDKQGNAANAQDTKKPAGPASLEQRIAEIRKELDKEGIEELDRALKAGKGQVTDRDLRSIQRGSSGREVLAKKAAQERGEKVEEKKKDPLKDSGKTFRGIVVHRYEQNHQEFWAGVLHTTPGGHDLDRKDIWPQIEEPLKQLNKLAERFKVPLLVGGDFYIPAEGVVKDPGKHDWKEMRDADKAGFWKTKAWHFARNFFLKAVDKGLYKKLIDNIKAAQGISQETQESMEIEENRDASRSIEAEKNKPVATGMEIEENKEKKGKKSKYQPRANLITPENVKKISEQWEDYKKLIIGYFNAGKFDKQFKNEMVRDLLAPDMDFDDVSWKKTLGYGETSQLTILRNYRRTKEGKDDADEEWEGPAVTMELALQELGYKVVISANPTNPKEKGAGENKMQLADLFLVNKYWTTTMGGIVNPEDARLQQVDNRKLDVTNNVTNISDHAPTVLIASTEENDPKVHQTFEMPGHAYQEVVQLNQDAWQRVAERLAGVKSTKDISPDDAKVAVREHLPRLNTNDRTPIDQQIEAIKAAMAAHSLGPAKPVPSLEEVANLRTMVEGLRQSVIAGKGNVPDPEHVKAIDEVLEDLGKWRRPHYVTDFSNTKDT